MLVSTKMKPTPRNLLQNIPSQIPREITETILNHSSCRIERIISKGQSSKEGFWYDQEQHEWVLIIQGEAQLRFEDGKVITLKAGDYLNIPAHCKHRVDWTTADTETIWLAIFYK